MRDLIRNPALADELKEQWLDLRQDQNDALASFQDAIHEEIASHHLTRRDRLPGLNSASTKASRCVGIVGPTYPIRPAGRAITMARVADPVAIISLVATPTIVAAYSHFQKRYELQRADRAELRKTLDSARQ